MYVCVCVRVSSPPPARQRYGVEEKRAGRQHHYTVHRRGQCAQCHKVKSTTRRVALRAHKLRSRMKRHRKFWRGCGGGAGGNNFPTPRSISVIFLSMALGSLLLFLNLSLIITLSVSPSFVSFSNSLRLCHSFVFISAHFLCTLSFIALSPYLFSSPSLSRQVQSAVASHLLRLEDEPISD